MSINRVNNLETQGSLSVSIRTSLSNTPNLSEFFLRQLTNSLTGSRFVRRSQSMKGVNYRKSSGIDSESKMLTNRYDSPGSTVRVIC